MQVIFHKSMDLLISSTLNNNSHPLSPTPLGVLGVSYPHSSLNRLVVNMCNKLTVSSHSSRFSRVTDEQTQSNTKHTHTCIYIIHNKTFT
jgi:hypothetical protein